MTTTRIIMRPRPLLASVAVALRTVDALTACDHIVDLINDFVDASVRWDVPRASRHGFLHLLQHLASLDPSGHLTLHQLRCVVEIAASKGHLQILQWAHTQPSNDRAFSVKTMNFAAFHGHLHVVQWLHSHRREGCTTKAMDGAACCGHLDIVQFLHASRHEGATFDAMDSAAMNGHLPVVSFLHHHRSEGCTTRAMDVAAVNGDLEMLSFLHAHRSEGCTSLAIKNAAKGSRFHSTRTHATKSVQVLQFLYDHYRSLFTSVEMETCKRIGPPEVIAWVQQLQIV